MDVFGYQDGLPQRKPISRRMILSADGTQCFMFYQDEVIQFPIHPMHHQDLSSDLMVHNVVVNNHQSFSFPGSTLKLKPGIIINLPINSMMRMPGTVSVSSDISTSAIYLPEPIHSNSVQPESQGNKK
jgi:hypothetical protein